MQVLSGKYTLRFAVGAPLTEERHVNEALKVLQDKATSLLQTLWSKLIIWCDMLFDDIVYFIRSPLFKIIFESNSSAKFVQSFIWCMIGLLWRYFCSIVKCTVCWQTWITIKHSVYRLQKYLTVSCSYLIVISIWSLHFPDLDLWNKIQRERQTSSFGFPLSIDPFQNIPSS